MELGHTGNDSRKKAVNKWDWDYWKAAFLTLLGVIVFFAVIFALAMGNDFTVLIPYFYKTYKLELNIVLAIIVIILSTFIVQIIIRFRNIKMVPKYSNKLKEIEELVVKYGNDSYLDSMKYKRVVESHKAYERFSLDNYLYEVLREDKDQVIEHLNEYDNYFVKYEDYLSQLKVIMSESSESYAKQAKVSLKSFIKIEDLLIAEFDIPKPYNDAIIELTVQYTSPGSRVYLNSSKKYTYEEVKTALDELPNHVFETNDFDPQYERSLMTDGLRYDILQRDGFRCQICGMSQKDGVRLHVDHIIPVAKGGRTIPSNLRTLCESCNRGKRDKYDPDRLN